MEYNEFFVNGMKLIGAGLAMLGTFGAGLGVGLEAVPEVVQQIPHRVRSGLWPSRPRYLWHLCPRPCLALQGERK